MKQRTYSVLITITAKEEQDLDTVLIDVEAVLDKLDDYEYSIVECKEE